MQLEATAAAMYVPLHYPELKGRRVLLTGAGTDDGRLIVHAFASHGCRLLLQFGADAVARTRLPDEVRPSAGAVRVLPGDFQDVAGIDRFTAAALRVYGGLDVVVNVSSLGADAASLRSETELGEALAQAFLPFHTIGRAIREAGRTSGAVINVLRLPAGEGRGHLALHAFAKTALESLTQAEARESFSAGLRFYGLIEGQTPGARDWAANEMLGDVLEHADPADNVAASAVLLASDKGRWLNGAVLSIGG